MATITCIVGARPNFMKVAPILKEIQTRPGLTAALIHTGQHYSPEMSDTFLRELGFPTPDVNLEVGGGTATWQTAAIMQKLEPVLVEQRPELVLVVGDVNSTLAATLVATKLGVPVAHVEAGLRSFDRGMPEEINRVLTDSVSEYLFVSEPSGMRNLAAEGVSPDRMFLVGNVMIDTLLAFRDAASRSDVLDRLGRKRGEYILTTLHRPANVDDPERLMAMAGMLNRLAADVPVVFPVHPRTLGRLESAGITAGNIQLTAPFGYLDFLHLTANARLVLTDSGGIQEETTVLGVPCLTLRENTERPATIEQGTNRLVGVDPEACYQAAREALAAPLAARRVPDLWDGRAAGRILDVLETKLAGRAAAA